MSLVYPRHLFAVVLYLKDKVDSEHDELQIYLTFSKNLIAWNQF